MIKQVELAVLLLDLCKSLQPCRPFVDKVTPALTFFICVQLLSLLFINYHELFGSCYKTHVVESES